MSVHLTNGIVSWWPLSDGNDLHSFISWLGVTGLQILSDCEQDLDRQGSDVCHLGKGLRQWISGE